MNLAIADTEQLESSDVWLATNVTAWCSRMGATLSAAACEQNRSYHLDNRCFGCGDLNHQAAPPKLGLPEPGALIEDDCIEGFEALNEIIDGLYEDPAPGDGFDDVEIDLDDEHLLALFPELARDEDDDTAPGFQRFTEYQEAVPRYAVYHGRCKRCGTGYMENTRERNDDEVYRCLECSWRTGPEYESNRAMKGVSP